MEEKTIHVKGVEFVVGRYARGLRDLSENEASELRDDIGSRGVIVPVIVDEDRAVIDGQHRLAYAAELGIEARFEIRSGLSEEQKEALAWDLNSKRRHLTKEERRIRIVEKVKAGATVREAAAAVGVPKSTAADDLKVAGISLSETGQPNNRATARDLRDAGKTQVEIAAELGVTQGRVSQLLKPVNPAEPPQDDEDGDNGTEAYAPPVIAESLRELKRKERDFSKPGFLGALRETGSDRKARQALKKEARDKKRAELDGAATTADQAEGAAVLEAPTVKTGEWWTLGPHLIYCGDTSSKEFYGEFDRAAFAFADPPYNSLTAVDEWDSGFEWGHDWLESKADVVAVTPGQNAIFDFANKTSMRFRWPLSCWIANGGARGALGHANWIFAALFSQQESLYRNAQDFLRITLDGPADTGHRGKKPNRFMAWLIDLFSEKGEVVIDPFLGSGTTLFVADELGRGCVGGELSPEYCAAIIARWQSKTGLQAKRKTDA